MRVNNSGRIPEDPMDGRSVDEINSVSTRGQNALKAAGGAVSNRRITHPAQMHSTSDTRFIPDPEYYEEEPLEVEEPAKASKRRRKPKKRKKRHLFKKYRKIWVTLIVFSLLGSAAGIYFGVVAPPPVEVNKGTSGYARYMAYINSVKNYNADSLNKQVKGSYVAMEKAYANGNEVTEGFIKGVTSTVKVEVPTVQYKTASGKLAVDPFTWKPILGTDNLNDGGSVTLQYIDYDQFPINKADLELLYKKAPFKYDDIEYTSKATSLFISYMNEILSSDNFEAPIKTEKKHTPNLRCATFSNCVVTKVEDSYLDRMLFSSKEFRDLQDEFAETLMEFADPEKKVAVKEDPVAKAAREAKEAKEKAEQAAAEGKEVTPEPTPTDECIDLDSLSEEDEKSILESTEGTSDKVSKDDPDKSTRFRKYDAKFYLSDRWIGAYRLQNSKDGNGQTKAIEPMVGDGTKENPAGLYTPVKTNVVSVDASGNVSKQPMQIMLTDLKENQDAFDIFSTLDTRNRGFTLNSPVRYVWAEFEVKNLSGGDLTITDNIFIGDSDANDVGRTGTIFGLTSSTPALKPGQTAKITTWQASENLDKFYMLWGKNFARKDPVIWFRVLGATSGKVSKVVAPQDHKSLEQTNPDVSKLIKPSGTPTPVTTSK